VKLIEVYKHPEGRALGCKRDLAVSVSLPHTAVALANIAGSTTLVDI
jgi:hypothetical protein